MLDCETVDRRFFVETGVAFAGIQGACERRREFADEAVVWEPEVAELKREADEVGYEVWGVDAAVDEDGTVDVGVGYGGEGGRLRRKRT